MAPRHRSRLPVRPRAALPAALPAAVLAAALAAPPLAAQDGSPASPGSAPESAADSALQAAQPGAGTATEPPAAAAGQPPAAVPLAEAAAVIPEGVDSSLRDSVLDRAREGLEAASGAAAAAEARRGPPERPLPPQRFTFGLREEIGASGNIRLAPDSAGTTYYSDTTLSLGYVTETRLQRFELSAAGVGRLVDDPLLGNDSGFRDPEAALRYLRRGANARFSLYARYERPDLAFLNPLERDEIDDQDLYSGGGRREEVSAGFRLETGLQAPLGLKLQASTRARSYDGTTDPLLFDSRTDQALAEVRAQLSPVLQGFAEVYEQRYEAEDIDLTETDTSRVRLGLGYSLAPAERLELRLGHEDVVETYGTRPGDESVTRGPTGEILYLRQMPDGVINASYSSELSTRGRQDTLQAGRIIDLPLSDLEASFGLARGETFDLVPIGSLGWLRDLPSGQLSLGLSRSAQISSILRPATGAVDFRATTTLRGDLGYAHQLSRVSAVELSAYYARIALTGDNVSDSAARTRASLQARYSHALTADWAVQVGYEHSYYAPADGASARSNTVFFGLERDFALFR